MAGKAAAVLIGLALGLAQLAGGAANAAYQGATYHGKPYCPNGTFFTPKGGGQCWSCKGGRHNAALPVTISGVCTRPAYTRYKPASLAKPTGRSFKTDCPKGYRLDIGAGKCYDCRDGRRSVHPVTSGKACVKTIKARAAYTKYKAARLKDPTGRIAKVNCSKGYSFDPLKKVCYRCGRGWVRSTRSVKSEKACFKVVARVPVRNVYSGASLREPSRRTVKVFCKQGYRYDIGARQCYSCGKGWIRSLSGVTHQKACLRQVAAKPYTATYVRDFGCGRGRFFDLRKGGQCWSCPAGYFRTVNPVTGKRACTNNVTQIFAGDKKRSCRRIIASIRKGTKGAQSLMAVTDKLTAPIDKTLGKLLDRMTPQIESPRELDKLLNKFGVALGPYSGVMAEVSRVSEIMKRHPRRLGNILLDEKLMCDGNPAQIDRALIAAGINPDFAMRTKRASLLDGLFIRSAHAATSRRDHVFHAFSLSNGVVQEGNKVGGAIAATLVTNFRGKTGFFVSPGPRFALTPGGDISLPDFDFFSALGIEFGFGAGEKLEELIDRKRKKDVGGEVGIRRKAGPADTAVQPGRNIWHFWPKDAGINFSMTPNFFRCPRDNPPGIGVSHSWGERFGPKQARKKRWIDATLSVDFAFRPFHKYSLARLEQAYKTTRQFFTGPVVGCR